MCKNDKRKMYKADDLEWWSELIETAQTYAGDMNLLAEKIKNIAHTEYGSTSTSITPKNIERGLLATGFFRCGLGSQFCTIARIAVGTQPQQRITKSATRYGQKDASI